MYSNSIIYKKTIMKHYETISNSEYSFMNTIQLRSNFLVQNLFQLDKINLNYTYYDRMIVGGVMPKSKTIVLPNPEALKAKYFLERRELGILNLGGLAEVTVDSKKYSVERLSCLYIGKGAKKVSFKSFSSKTPALLYLLSAPAHHTYPTTLFTKEQASPVQLGTVETANKRTVFKYIHLDGIKSCQLVMGLTFLDMGNVWNSIPPHIHTRRMEVYLYFDVPTNQAVFHFMGTSQETRHIVVSNNEAVLSPPWSTHFGCGTSNYGFVWGMAGENLDYTDMDGIAVANIR